MELGWFTHMSTDACAYVCISFDNIHFLLAIHSVSPPQLYLDNMNCVYAKCRGLRCTKNITGQPGVSKM